MDAPTVETREHVVIRFAGDSGDGMQVTGSQFTNTTANYGNDLSTFPDYPAEIRAPAGTLAGVSGFQVHFSSNDIQTPGDDLDVLVAMNPAALTVHLEDLPKGGILIVNTSEFTARNLQKAGLESNPLEDGTLDDYQYFPVDLTNLAAKTLEDVDLPNKIKARCKNMFALGMMYFLYSRPLENTIDFFKTKFGNKPLIVEANTKVLHAGHAFAETCEMFGTRYEVPAAPLEAGLYRTISGNQAIALGFVAASKRAGLDLFLGSYPITPASDILHELSKLKNFGIRTFQAEDEIAAVAATIGAAFGGTIGITTTSGPGLALKGEAIGLAMMAELPMVIVNIQRGGPSTGLPTKTEQSDLLQSIFGRNGDSPVPVLSASTPSDCFWTAFEAVRIAIRHMTPVILLSDGYLANGSEPWKIPNEDDVPLIDVQFATDPESYQPYSRNEHTLGRPWAIPGTPGLEHRLGGLEKDDGSGNVSYDPHNHDKMVRMRAEKVDRIANDLPPTEVHGDPSGDVLVLGWGSTSGACRTAVDRARGMGWKVSHAHLRWVHPLPSDLGDIMDRFQHVIVPEMNLGQLAFLLRGRLLKNVISYSKVQGKPFMVTEILAKIAEVIGGTVKPAEVN